jgi:hypothetical protein
MTARSIIGLVLLAAAGLFGVADMWHTMVPYGGGSDIITMGRLWVMVSVASMNMADDLVHRYLWPPIWDFGVAPLLLAPAWAFFGALGMLFMIFGRPKVADQS